MKKVLISFMVIAMMGFVAGSASADYLQANWNGVGVTIYDPAGGPVGTTAGGATVNFGPTSLNYQTYQAVCVDYGNIGSGQGYNSFTMINVPNLAAYNEAAYIMEHYGTGALAQLAVWEVVFEGLSGIGPVTVKPGTNQGKFYVTADGGLDLTAADIIVADAILNGQNFDTSSYRLLASPMTSPPLLWE
jgi:hypothetical protein